MLENYELFITDLMCHGILNSAPVSELEPSRIVQRDRSAKAVALAADKTRETLLEISESTGATPAEGEEALHTLANLALIDLEFAKGFYRTRFTHLVLSQDEQRHQPYDVRGYSDCYFNEFATSYIENVSTNFSTKTRQNAARVIGLFSEFIGRTRLADLTGDDLEQFKRPRKDKVKDATTNVDVSTLKAALQVAVTLGMIPSNRFRPVTLIWEPKKSNADHSPVRNSLACVRQSRNRRSRRFAVVVLTGLRRGEVMDLQWDRVDLGTRQIRSESSIDYWVKFGRTKDLPIYDQTLRIL